MGWVHVLEAWDEDGNTHVLGVFTTVELAQEYIATQIKPEVWHGYTTRGMDIDRGYGPKSWRKDYA